MDIKDLSGSVKAAILVRGLGKDASEKILKSLSDKDREFIYKLMSQMGDIQQDLVDKVAEEFVSKLNHKGDLQPKSNSRRQSTPQTSDDKAEKSAEGNLRAIQSIEPDRLTLLIKDEHPQTVAIILAHLKPEVAGMVLSDLPDDKKVDIALRIASLDKVVSGMVDEINMVFEDVLKRNKKNVTQKAGGVRCLAEILNQIKGDAGGIILDDLEEDDPDIADQIRQLMFVFDDIVLVDDKGLQQVLRSVETSVLAMALKASAEEVKHKILENMSERAGEILKEEIEALGAVRMKEVSDAQQSITRLIQEKESKGELLISGRGGDDFVG